MDNFTQYKRKGLSEMKPYVFGENMEGVSISHEDVVNGSPQIGDMIARNPKNHNDQWLVAKDYFEDNLELAVVPVSAGSDLSMSSRNMNFGQAIHYMKEGHKVARSGWNGKGMWITIGKGATIHADNFWNPHTKQHAIDNGGTATVDDYIIMKTAAGTICMGWLASQADILADDWEIVL